MEDLRYLQTIDVEFDLDNNITFYIVPYGTLSHMINKLTVIMFIQGNKSLGADIWLKEKKTNLEVPLVDIHSNPLKDYKIIGQDIFTHVIYVSNKLNGIYFDYGNEEV